MKLTYRNKLFFGIIALVWAIFGGIFYYHYTSEIKYKKQMLRNELLMIDQRIMSVYEDGEDYIEFIRLLELCYKNSTFDAIQISIYNDRDSLVASVRQPIPHDLDRLEDLQPEDKATRLVKYQTDNKTKLFYFSSNKSSDGKITVKTGMPYNFSINRAISTEVHWWILALVSIIAAVIVFLSTKVFSRNIFLLRKFAIQASRREPIDDITNFPNDELGEIAQEILNIYKSLIKAIDDIDKEHQNAIRAIEEKEAFKRRVTNNINHEIKTPLSIISGYVETMLNTPDMDQDTRNKFMKRTLENVDRLKSLLSDISTIAKLEESSAHIAISEVNLYDIVVRIGEDLRFTNFANNMTFNYDIPPTCNVLGDRELLNSVLLNLMRNSILHSNGTKMTLSLIEETDDSYVFSFADDGAGVKQEQLEHLFERFYRTDSGRSRKKGGVGLGLSIVKSAIEILGGQISVTNRQTGGLEFLFSLHKASD